MIKQNQTYKPSMLSTLALIASVALMPATANSQNVEFKYSGDTGPTSWGELDSQWSACSGAATNAIQSPINVSTVRKDKTLRKLDLTTYPTTVDIFNNGHTIEQRYEGTGSKIHWNESDYELAQFHFHTLSEHTINNSHSALELHAVFTDVEGRYVVVSQLFSIAHKDNPFIQSLIDAGLPTMDGDESQSNASIDLSDVLRNTKSYYTYTGSLTTPPCTEGVTWLVLQKPQYLSANQYDEFRDILGNNFRPLQKANGRNIRATARGLRGHQKSHD